MKLRLCRQAQACSIFAWDGRDKNGKLVPKGAYLLMVGRKPAEQRILQWHAETYQRTVLKGGNR